MVWIDSADRCQKYDPDNVTSGYYADTDNSWDPCYYEYNESQANGVANEYQPLVIKGLLLKADGSIDCDINTPSTCDPKTLVSMNNDSDVDEGTGNASSGQTGVGTFGSLSASIYNDGTFAIAFDANFKVYAKAFNANGTQKHAVTYADKIADGADIAMTALPTTGQFVLAWNNWGRLFVNRFGFNSTNSTIDRVGNATDPEVVSNDGSSFRQLSIAADSEGNYVLVWEQEKASKWSIGGLTFPKTFPAP